MIPSPTNPDASIGGIATVKDTDVADDARIQAKKIITKTGTDLQTLLDSLNDRLVKLGG